MEPGRELDVKIAKELFGWKSVGKAGDILVRYRDGWDGRNERIMGPVFLPPDVADDPQASFDEIGHIAYTVPHYSTRIEDAWKVVERMHKLGWSIDLLDNLHFPDAPELGHWWEAEASRKHMKIIGSGDTVPHAICDVALEAIRYGTEKK